MHLVCIPCGISHVNAVAALWCARARRYVAASAPNRPLTSQPFTAENDETAPLWLGELREGCVSFLPGTCRDRAPHLTAEVHRATAAS